MSRGASQAQAALTRSQAEESKKIWESLQNLFRNAMQGLAQFGNDTAPASLLRLTELLAGNTEDPETLWRICTQIKLVRNQDATYR